MRGLLTILSHFRSEFNKLNNTGARMFDSIYHMPLKLLESRILGVKHQYFAIFTQYYNGRHFVTLLICKPLVVYRFYCMALYHSQTRRHMIKDIKSMFLFLYKVDFLNLKVIESRNST